MSMLKKNVFWDEVKVKKGTKDPATGLEIKRMLVPNKKYFETLEKLFEEET